MYLYRDRACRYYDLLPICAPDVESDPKTEPRGSSELIIGRTSTGTQNYLLVHFPNFNSSIPRQTHFTAPRDRPQQAWPLQAKPSREASIRRTPRSKLEVPISRVPASRRRHVNM